MSIFSRLRGVSASTDNTIPRAILIPAVSTMMADGNASDGEIVQLGNLCAFSPIFAKFDQKQLLDLVKSINGEIATNGHERTIAGAARNLSPALRETALCFAIRLALADGRVTEQEKASLSQTGLHMGIPAGKFSRILEVIAMMQRPLDA